MTTTDKRVKRTTRHDGGSVRTTILLPLELRDRLKNRPDLNWSKICAEALSAELGGPVNLGLRLSQLEAELAELRRQVDGARKALGG